MSYTVELAGSTTGRSISLLSATADLPGWGIGTTNLSSEMMTKSVACTKNNHAVSQYALCLSLAVSPVSVSREREGCRKHPDVAAEAHRLHILHNETSSAQQEVSMGGRHSTVAICSHAVTFSKQLE
jgi:hypothetical protein